MNAMLSNLASAGAAQATETAAAEEWAVALSELSGLEVYARSVTSTHRSLFFLGKRDEAKAVGCLTRDALVAARLSGERHTVQIEGEEALLVVGPANATNAAALRTLLPFLQPRTWGLQPSAGCGDRLGLATPGHIRAFRRVFGDGGSTGGSWMAPILAQQSIRENVRTGRTPQQVLDDAMWGVFQEGWRHGYGADADHLKTPEDVEVCAAAGYTFFTVDPGEHVDDEANTAPLDVLKRKVAALPWDVLQSSPDDLQSRLAGKKIDLGDRSTTLSSEDLLRASAKYGNAVAHTVNMAAHLAKAKGDHPFELEMSVDETETITSLAEHLYIAAELQRLGVKVVSLAPRYVGTFEKGVDYIGNPADFARSFAGHVAVAKTFGPYKLSLHSGSDKFTIYPIAAQLAGDLVHLKTAGTSYLEALRAIATLDPLLFREIVAFALERYPIDRTSYHVSAEVDKAPNIAAWSDEQLPSLLDNFHAREILHVTFGSVLNHPEFRPRFFAALRSHEETYSAILETHFVRHFAPFRR
jgi:hypothetical protein